MWRCHHSSVSHSTDGAAGCSRGPGPGDTHFSQYSSTHLAQRLQPCGEKLRPSGHGKPAVPRRLRGAGVDTERQRARGRLPKHQLTQTEPWGQVQSQPGNYEAHAPLNKRVEMWCGFERPNRFLQQHKNVNLDLFELHCLRAQWSGLHLSGGLRQRSGFKDVSASNTGSVRGWIYDAGHNGLSSLSTHACLR